jgi:tRNA (cmo5U34)-methyltransferase
MTPNFDSVAPFYDRLASLVFGKQLKKAQLHFLPYIQEGATVLVIGGGTGWYLQELLHTGRYSRILYLEASAKMLALSQKAAEKIEHNCAVEFRLGTEAALKPGEKFDVVVTSFLLDLFPEEEAWQLMKKLSSALDEGGTWLFTDFCIDTAQAPRLWQRFLLKSMYLFFSLLSKVEAKDLPGTSSMFSRLGFKRIVAKSFYGGFVRSEVWKHSL